jgi:hypothetical protein
MPDPPDVRLAFLKMVFGFMLLIALVVLAALIAMGRVEQTSSYGLEGIIGGLTALAGGFVNWAFTVGKDK